VFAEKKAEHGGEALATRLETAAEGQEAKAEKLADKVDSLAELIRRYEQEMLHKKAGKAAKFATRISEREVEKVAAEKGASAAARGAKLISKMAGHINPVIKLSIWVWEMKKALHEYEETVKSAEEGAE
jgi:hypothetical protein